MTTAFPQEIYSFMMKLTYIINAIILIPVFIMYSFSLFTLAKRQNIENAFLAWIPGANYYILASLVQDAPYIKNKFKNIKMFALVGGIVYVLLMIITLSFMSLFDGNMYSTLYITYMISSIVFYLISISIRVLSVFMHYHLFKLYFPKEATLYTVLCVFSLSAPILFAIRKYDRLTIEENVTQPM